ncbi:hypothetical protein GOP47_0006089 [Adiantum capillus-veneris]|uniref:RRM domain-containing protein n=1 Tax=Adiantum capillus-veneris TaxID=13818 RepID=A0A9D4V2E4_ADICA|nr:hypothetical protein GOP47_0006089 [Adiantum capillus-veneris]
MAISACEESDGKEESGRDCCTTSCAKGCLQNPSLNPPPLCTQQRLLHAPQQLPEEEGPLAEVEEEGEEVGDGDAPDAIDDDDYDADEDAVISPPSPSHPLIHPPNNAFTETPAVDSASSAERGNHSAECCHDQTDMAPSTTPSSSSSELRHHAPLPSSSPHSDPTPPFSRHSQRQRRAFSAASLDPNAREFVPIASPLFPPPPHFQQSQTEAVQSSAFPQADMAPLYHQMGSLNLDMGASNAIAYEGVPPPHHEMSAAFYTAHPTEMGYHTPSTAAELGYNQELGVYQSTGYAIYHSAPHVGYPSTQGGLLTPPWHNQGLPPMPSAMAPTPAPLVASHMAPVATSMAPMPPFSHPSMYPSAASMEAHLLSTLQSQKQFPVYHGLSNPKEHVSRTLLISGIPAHISETQLREELECWGAIRGIQTDAYPQGLQVMVQFFDLRAARQALRDMQNFYMAHQHQQLYSAGMIQSDKRRLAEEGHALHGRKGVLCGCIVSAQYIGSWGMAVPEAHNQGTLVLFNVGADVNMQDVRQVFEAYGHVREVREAPAKRQHKFVEFYDVRAAATAWSALNGKEICGKCVKIEFSRQGGGSRRLKPQQDKAPEETSAIGSNRSITHGHTVDPCGWHGNAATYGLSLYSTGLQPQGWDKWPSHEGVPAGQFPVNVCMAGGPHEMERSMYPAATPGPHIDAGNGIGGENVGIAYGGRRMHSESGRVPTAQSAKERFAGVSRLSKGLSHYQFDEGEMYAHPSNPRTTLMIQNIPNKYSQKMLLTMLDQHCLQFNSDMGGNELEAAYDFMYLPIDFKNKCNLGYAFVNFTTPQATLGFYKTFHGKAWEEFNSRKICGVAYARLQGRPALEEHFKNSRFACDTEEYLPVLFVPPRNGTNQSQPRVAVGQQGLVRGVRSGNGVRSYFSNDPCNQQDDKEFLCSAPSTKRVLMMIMVSTHGTSHYKKFLLSQLQYKGSK